jgi:hypothetical protein
MEDMDIYKKPDHVYLKGDISEGMILVGGRADIGSNEEKQRLLWE